MAAHRNRFTDLTALGAALALGPSCAGTGPATRPSTAPEAAASVPKQTPRPLGSTPARLGFHEYLPPGYDDGQPRPLLVFFHGLGENGNGASDLAKVLVHGPPQLIAAGQWPADRPFVVLSPQHSGGGCPDADEIHDFITFALGHYRIDTRRVYFTGLSCGANGGWRYLAGFRGAQIAAAVLIAGDGRRAWEAIGCGLGDVAIWAIHGENDAVVPAVGSIETMNKLMACPAPPRREARLTIYPGVDHNSWTRTYDGSAGHDVYAWLLGFQR